MIKEIGNNKDAEQSSEMMQAVNNTIPTNLGAPQSPSTDESDTQQQTADSDFVNHGKKSACSMDCFSFLSVLSSFSNKYLL